MAGKFHAFIPLEKGFEEAFKIPFKDLRSVLASQVYLDSKSGWESSTYYVRFQVNRERRTVVLKASTKEDAANEALGIYLGALVSGWSASERRVAPKKTGENLPASASGPTIEVGKNWVSSVSQVRQETIGKYFEALCCIVGESLGRRCRRIPGPCRDAAAGATARQLWPWR
jgi:hypothetical protein